jgi:acyl-CoA thioesterase-1
MRTLLACAIAMLVAGGTAGVPAGAAVQQPAPAGTPRIVALGDSLTSGRGIGKAAAYPAVLQQRLDEAGLPFEVVNAGVSGATSADGVRRLADALEGNVAVLIVALGANDGLRGAPVDRLASNLGRIIGEAQARGIAVLLCGMEALPIYGLDYSLQFHRVYVELAERHQLPLVPFMLAGVIGREGMMQRDRIHPTAEGARVIADNIWPHLAPLLESARPTRVAATR